MISKTRNTPVSGKDIFIYIFGEDGWKNVASFSSGTLEFSTEDQKYYYLGSKDPVTYSQSNLISVTLERNHVNAEIMKEFKKTMSESNCGYNRPEYSIQIQVCFPGDDEYSGKYLYRIKNAVFKTNSISLQAGNAENTETLTIEGSDYDVEKM